MTINSPLFLPSLFAWLLVAFIAAGAGAIASVDAASFYSQLARPSWAPPAGAFGPVWSVLYALMGVAVWLVWRADRRRVAAFTIFVVQLAVNAVWSWLFFAWRLGALAFIDALVLFALIAVTIVLFWRASRAAALLLIPYLAWVGFASALTWSVWQRNPGLLT